MIFNMDESLSRDGLEPEKTISSGQEQELIFFLAYSFSSADTF
jgi:hypothetical protein